MWYCVIESKHLSFCLKLACLEEGVKARKTATKTSNYIHDLVFSSGHKKCLILQLSREEITPTTKCCLNTLKQNKTTIYRDIR